MDQYVKVGWRKTPIASRAEQIQSSNDARRRQRQNKKVRAKVLLKDCKTMPKYSNQRQRRSKKNRNGSQSTPWGFTTAGEKPYCHQ